MHQGLRNTLLLFGAFAFGYNAAHAIHEVGHVLAMWASGGHVARVVLHPFSWSKVHYGSPLTCPLFVTWAGAAFAATCGLLLLLAVRRLPGAWTAPIVITGLCTLFVNGIYLLVDCLFQGGGDATILVRHGTPPAVVFMAGIALLGLGCVVGYRMLPRIGVTATQGFAARFALLEGGIGTYLLLMIVYHLSYNRSEAMLWLTFVGSGLIVLGTVAWGSGVIARWAPTGVPVAVPQPSWITVVGCLLAGTAVVMLELLVYHR